MARTILKHEASALEAPKKEVVSAWFHVVGSRWSRELPMRTWMNGLGQWTELVELGEVFNNGQAHRNSFTAA